jgi:protoheme IX farnesyltransferase
MNKVSIIQSGIQPGIFVSNPVSRLLLHFEIAKIPMCLFISLSSFVGYEVVKPEFSPMSFLTAAGIFLLACGCATLNNIQDKEFDRHLKRTKNRALPQNKISETSASVQAVLLITSGLMLVYLVGNAIMPVVFSAVAIVLYNFIYTKMKIKTSMAIFPGALCGMLPPFIGSLVAGAHPFDLRIITVAILFGLWQVPHYFLIVLDHHDDYKQGNLPSILDIFTIASLNRIIFAWIMSISFLMLLLAPLNVISTTIAFKGLVLNAFCLVVFFAYRFFLVPETNYRKLFKILNASLMIMLLLVFADRFFT